MKCKYTIGNCKYESEKSNNLAEIEWTLQNGRFSASGGIWQSNKRDYTTCGQILEELLSLFPDDELVNKIVKVWRKWHLNDLTAGSPRQTEFLEQFTDTPRSDYYTWAKDKLSEAGIEPDESFQYNGKAYSYGSAWLHTDLPDSVIDEINSWSSYNGVLKID